MKGYSLLSGIFFSLFFFNCQIQMEKKRTIEDGLLSVELEEYQSKEYKFSIDYPKEWRILNGNEDVIFVAKMVRDSLNRNFQNTIHITKLLENNSSEVSLNDIVEANINDMVNSFDDFKIITKEETFINQFPAIRAKCQFSANGVNIMTIMYFVKAKDYVYLIGLSESSNNLTNYEMVYDFIANSFRSDG